MSAVRFYVDEDAEEHAVVQGLRNAGIDVLTVSEAGMDCETDDAQLFFAALHGRALYSLNVGDFCRIHREFLVGGKEHAGHCAHSSPAIFDAGENPEVDGICHSGHGGRYEELVGVSLSKGVAGIDHARHRLLNYWRRRTGAAFLTRGVVMCTFTVRWGAFFLAVGIAAATLAGESDDGPLAPLVSGELTEFARRAFQITELVLDKHVEPPTRQEMLLCGLTAAHQNVAPGGLSRAVSRVASEEEFVECLVRFWPEKRNDLERDWRRIQFLYGLGQAVPGGLDFKSGKEAAVERQLAANQYVGIGIALARDENVYRIGETFPRGPAAEAGIAAGELLVEVDGVKTEKLSMTQVIDRLRGTEGTTVTVGIARGKNSNLRSVTLTRGVVPRQTVVGHRKLAPEQWETVIEDEKPVAYLKVDEIAGSTVAELRDYEAELLAKGVDLLVLDLRRCGGDELRHAIVLADALIDGGNAGMVRSRRPSRPSCALLTRRRPLRHRIPAKSRQAGSFSISLVAGGVTSRRRTLHRALLTSAYPTKLAVASSTRPHSAVSANATATSMTIAPRRWPTFSPVAVISYLAN